MIDFWYTLPIRIALRCNDASGAHLGHPGRPPSTAPPTCLHLHQQKTDIRQYELAVFCRHDLVSKKSTVIYVNLDSDLPDAAEDVTPILDTVIGGGANPIDRNPHWVGVIFIGVAVHSWKGALEFLTLALDTEVCVL